VWCGVRGELGYSNLIGRQRLSLFLIEGRHHA